LPTGWKARQRKLGRRVLEGLISDETGQPRQLLIVERGVSNADSLRGHVDLLLREGNAQLLNGSLLLDKKFAYRVKRSGPYPGMAKTWAQQRIITTAYGKQTFTISFMADKRQDIEKTEAALLRGWRWQPFASPATYLQPSPEPLLFPQAQLRLSIPQSMGIFSVDETSAMLSAYDAQNNLAAFTFNIALVSVPNTFSLQAMRGNFGTVLQKQFNLRRPLTWKDSSGQPARTMSNFFETNIAEPDSPGPTLTSYGLVKSSGKEWVLLTFNINAQDVKSRTLYMAAARKILDSIRNDSSGPVSY
jgi:hypothetical protein